NTFNPRIVPSETDFDFRADALDTCLAGERRAPPSGVGCGSGRNDTPSHQATFARWGTLTGLAARALVNG
ncbi:hypothetical protein ACCS78_30890, partial [Rhizobium johnstonii]